MLELWPHWLRPYWLLLLPLLGWLLWQLWHRQQRVGRWETLLPPAFHKVLLSGGTGHGGRLRWVALGVAWLLALLALLGPSWQQYQQSNLKPFAPLVVLLELSPEMMATDVAPNRLQQAKRKLLDLLQAREDAQTAVVVFAGSAHTLVPLSDDLATTRNLLEALTPSIMPEPGHRADLAVQRALELLQHGAQGQGQLLLIGSQLSAEERKAIRQQLGRSAPSLHILGIGTTQGAPIAAEGGGFVKDAQGSILMPRLDQGGLARFAENLGGRYHSATVDDQDLRRLGLLNNRTVVHDNGDSLRLASWVDQGYWFLLPLLLLAACAGRRGWLFCLPLLLAMPQLGHALEFDDLWLRPDQQGQRLLQAQRPAEAAERFTDPQWQGYALYQAGDYPAAAERFAQSDSAQAHYNRGNALARAEQFEAALDAYDQALEQQPDLQPAQANKALIEELLRQRQAQSQPSASEAEEPEPEQDQEQAPPSSASSGPSEPQPDSSAEPSATPTENAPEAAVEAGKATQDPAASAEANAASAEGDTPAPAQTEQRQALEQWLQQIPDDPGELLRRKFRYQQQQRQEQHP